MIGRIGLSSWNNMSRIIDYLHHSGTAGGKFLGDVCTCTCNYLIIMYLTMVIIIQAILRRRHGYIT
jgi:hypothetical protein